MTEQAGQNRNNEFDRDFDALERLLDEREKIMAIYGDHTLTVLNADGLKETTDGWTAEQLASTRKNELTRLDNEIRRLRDQINKKWDNADEQNREYIAVEMKKINDRVQADIAQTGEDRTHQAEPDVRNVFLGIGSEPTAHSDDASIDVNPPDLSDSAQTIDRDPRREDDAP